MLPVFPVSQRRSRCRRSAWRIVLSFCGLCAGLVEGAEPWSFQQIAIPGGGPVGHVSNVIEAEDGAIWVATWGEGVHRIQGTDWTTFTESEGLPDDWTRHVTAAPGGGVWVSTGDGLAHIHRGTVTVLNPSNTPALPEADIAYVKSLPDGRLFVGTFQGWFLRYTPADPDAPDYQTGWTTLATPSPGARNTVSDVIEVEPNRFLVSFRTRQLAWITGGELEYLPDHDPPHWYCLYMSQRGGRVSIWAAAREGAALRRLDGEAWHTLSPAPLNTYALGQDSYGAYYAVTQHGFHRRIGSDWQEVMLGPDLGSPTLRSMVMAADGSVWLGGNEGLIRGVPLPWVPLQQGGQTPLGLLARASTEEKVYALGEGGTLFQYLSDGWVLQRILTNWPAVDFSPANAIWLSDGQTWEDGRSDRAWLMVQHDRLHCVYKLQHRRYDLADGTLLSQVTIPALEPPSGRYALTEDDELWGLSESGLYRLNETWEPIVPVGESGRDWVNVVLQTGPEEFWIGRESGGLLHMRSGERKEFGEADGIETANSINAACVLRNGDIWFGSNGSGLYYYDGESFTHFNKATGLQSNNVRSIYEARDGAIWVAYRGSGVSVNRFGRWLHYGTRHGLPNTAALRFAEVDGGELWIGAHDQSLYRYQQDEQAPDTMIRLGPSEVGPFGVGIFSYTGRDAWDLTSARDLFYSWRVVSEDDDSERVAWSPFQAETTVATPALTAGHYRFEVRSSDEHGNVDGTAAVHRFAVVPPIWRKPVFLVPVLCSALLAAIALLARYRSHRALRVSEHALRSEIAVRKRTEALLEAHREQLEQTVEARTEELRAAQEALIQKERLATLGQLTATVSHELRNPLGTIQSSLYTIEKRVHGAGLNLERVIERTVRSIRRCNGIIEEMLDYTRSQKVSLRKVPLDDWLMVTTDEMTIPADVVLERTFQSDAVVSIDTELIRRVLINLIDNSTQAMEIQTTEKRIEITATSEPGAIRLTVEDTGPGVPEEVLAHIFDPLFSTKNFGVGLGTNIVKNIVDRHGGTTVYGNKPDGGARVEITLPYEEQPHP